MQCKRWWINNDNNGIYLNNTKKNPKHILIIIRRKIRWRVFKKFNQITGFCDVSNDDDLTDIYFVCSMLIHLC